ncbi:hypothetical protein AB0P37_36545, partial [Streptomyces antimycoticus]
MRWRRTVRGRRWVIRARMPVTAAALAHCGIDPGVLTEFATTPVYGGGVTVGGVHPTDALAPPAA